MRSCLLILIILCCRFTGFAQVLGGKNVFPFLDLPATPQLTALGSMNVSQQLNDVSLTLANPALLRPAMHSDLQVNFTSYFADVKYGHAMLGY